MHMEIVIVEVEVLVVQTGYEMLEGSQKIYVPFNDIVIEMDVELLLVHEVDTAVEIVLVTIVVVLAIS